MIHAKCSLVVLLLENIKQRLLYIAKEQVTEKIRYTIKKNRAKLENEIYSFQNTVYMVNDEYNDIFKLSLGGVLKFQFIKLIYG